MDSDYGLPVPMHRPIITLGEQFDSPLPFRRRLEQVTELTAENATPYQLPKEQRLSAFERLPYEVREQIYGYLGIESAEWPMCSCGFRCIMLYNYECQERAESKGMLKTNRNIRHEVLDIILQKANLSLVYPVNNKKIIYSSSHKTHHGGISSDDS
jgi:hypothetical protein